MSVFSAFRNSLPVAVIWILFTSLASAIYVNPGSLTFTYDGVTQPRAVNVAITGANGFTARVATNPAGWLSVSPPSGSVPAVLLVSVNPGGLATGQYIGIVTVTDTAACTFSNTPCSRDLQVTLSVTQSSGSGGGNSQWNGFSYVPQVVDGGGWQSSLMFVNSTNQAESCEVAFWDDNGRSMIVSILGYGGVRLVSLNVPPRGIQVLETTDVGSTVRQGWAAIRCARSNAVSVNFVFRQRVPGRPDFEVSGAATPFVRRLILPFDNTRGYSAGLALANTGEQGTVQLIVRDSAGLTIVTDASSMVSGEHVAYALSDRYPATLNARGTVEILSQAASSPGVSALALRFNPSGAVSGLSPSYAGN